MPCHSNVRSADLSAGRRQQAFALIQCPHVRAITTIRKTAAAAASIHRFPCSVTDGHAARLLLAAIPVPRSGAHPRTHQRLGLSRRAESPRRVACNNFCGLENVSGRLLVNARRGRCEHLGSRRLRATAQSRFALRTRRAQALP